MRITSTHNSVAQYVRSLHGARARRDEGVYIAEGVRLVAEARRERQPAPIILYDPDLLIRSAAGSSLLEGLPAWGDNVYEVNERILKSISATETPAGVVAVLRRPPSPALGEYSDARCGVILDGLSDPGNAGTILRAADAFGVSYVATTSGSVDLFAPKVVRSAMGAHFRLPLISGIEWGATTASLPHTVLVAAAMGQGDPVHHFRWPPRSAIVIGSEASGLSDEGSKAVHTFVHISMKPGVESLNAAIAAAILMYAARTATARAGE